MEVLSDGSAEGEKEKILASDAEEQLYRLRQRFKGIQEHIGQIKSWRRAENQDIDAIEGLMIISEEEMDSLFNTPHLDHLLEKSHFPIVQLDGNGKIVSFTAFQSHPNIPSVPPFSWIEWINEKYRLSDANSRNSLFIHYMVWDPAHKTEFLYLLLKTTFLEFIHIKYIIFVKPPFVHIPEIYKEHFIPVYPCDVAGSEGNVQSVNICPRCSLIERLHIRTAIAEDSDFLMSLLPENYNTSFQTLYEDFFSAELTDFPGSDRRVLVCEVDGVAAGVMVVNLSVDLDSLNDFELMPFHGLRTFGETHSTNSYDSSMGALPSGTRTPEILEALRSQDFDILDIDSFGLGTSIVDLKENESATSSDDTYDIDFRVLNVSSSLQKLIRGDSSHSEESTPKLEFGVGGDANSSGEIHARRGEKLLTQVSSFPSPRYVGEPNAFAIEFFATDTRKLDERQSIDFVEASFGIAHHMDYCILMVPTHTPPLPLLTHFVKASHRGGKQPRSELYICHKSIFSRFPLTVREADSLDSDEIKRFLQGTYNSGVIYSEFQNSFREDSTEKSFKLVAGSHIVGIALLRYSFDFQILAEYFDVAEFSILDLHDTENRSLVQHLLLIPPYHSFAKFFLLDVMRLADVTCLFHLYHHEAKLNGSIPSVLGELVPLKPKKMQSKKWKMQEVDNTSFRLREGESFAVFFTNSQMCCRMRINTNKIIVVIGASATAFSFFENIIFGSSRNHVCYSNLIWISAHGTGQELPPNKIRDLMFPVRDKYDRDYRTLLSLKAHVHFIYGVMTGINRKEKYVILNDRAVVRYDILILTVGLQFLRPIPEVSKIKQECHRNKFHRSSLSRFLPSRVSTQETGAKPNPINLFEMNTFLEADTILMAFQHLKTRIQSGVPAEKIILYGHSIRIFVVMQALLKIGLPGGMIAFVEPFPTRESSITAFGDPAVYNEVINSVRKCGILYYPEFFLYEWTFSSDRLSTVTFHSSGGQVTFSCLAFLPLDEKLVSNNNFCACNNAGLIYDGKLIIDNRFRTNDERIYAAGPFTKYSRRYCAPEKAHQYFSSTEVGEKLAEFIRKEVELPDEQCDELIKDADSVPTLKKPLMIYCQVPGDCYFFSLRKPGNPVELESSFESGNTGDILITGDCAMNKGIGYFRLHLDQFGCVQRITCFCKTEFDYMNLYTLYGLHEKLLNNLLVRYDCGLIPDLFEYFQQPWTEAIFHGEFHCLSEQNIRQFSEEENISSVGGIRSREGLNKWKPLPGRTRMKLELDPQLSGVKAAIERNVLEFINYFDDELTKYATPKSVEELVSRAHPTEKKDRYEKFWK